KQIGWIDDPTNADQRYERPRVRKKLGEADGEAAIAQALKAGAEAARRRELLGDAAAKLIRGHAGLLAPGLFRLGPDFFETEQAEPAILALRILLAVAGGTPHLPDAARTQGLFARLAAGGPVRAVLSRALIDRRKAGAFLLREARGLPAASGLRDGSVWDGRYRLLAPSSDFGVTQASPLDEEGEHVSGADGPDSLVRQASGAQPALITGWNTAQVLAPCVRYLQSFAIAPARAAAALAG